MTMQYDVKSFHATASSLAYGDRARLKGVVISPIASTTFNSCVVDTAGALTGTYDIPGSTTCTVTIANHGLSNGDRVGFNFTSGTAVDDSYVVANVTTNTFTITTASLTTSGNVTMYPKVLVELDSSSGTAYYTLIPGEGILAAGGLFCLLPSTNVSMTIFYG
jgi:hypothetical protein